MKTFTFFFCLLWPGGQALATHLLGGYIQARPTAGSALTYEVTVFVYVNGTPTGGDNSISICFGDGSTAIANLLDHQILSVDRTSSVSTYRLTHTYPGPGTYAVSTTLTNRNESRNIATNAQEPLTLSTTFTTNATTSNRTPTLSVPQMGFRVAVNQRVVFPLKATDDDGDSLVYTLATPLTAMDNRQCVRQRVSTYQFPNDLTRQGTFKLDGRTGDLTWDAPTQLGYFSVAVTVGEYRNGLLISQTNQEIPLLVVDRPGTPGVIPPYEPALEGGLVTALPNYRDETVTLTVFPNPVDDRLQVVAQTSNPATAQMQLLDSNGRTVHDMVFGRLARRHEQVISMNSLTPGLYVLRAKIGDQTLVRKVVKK